MAFSFPVTDAQSELAGIGVYNLTDKEEVRSYVKADPAVAAGAFSYELLGCMGPEGDSLK